MKKIMFSDKYGLTKAVLSGRKTQTRRAVSDRLWDEWTDYDDFCSSVAVGDIPTTREYYDEKKFFLDHSPYKVGEVVAIAQSYCDIDKFYQIAHNRMYSVHGMTVTPYDGVSKKEIHDWLQLRKELKDSAGWTNKMFVTADKMLHCIRITNVRVERLKDISDEDCMDEGIEYDQYDLEYDTGDIFDYSGNDGDAFDTPREAYAALIDKIYGKGTFDSNPFVFVYDFELIK